MENSSDKSESNENESEQFNSEASDFLELEIEPIQKEFPACFCNGGNICEMH